MKKNNLKKLAMRHDVVRILEMPQLRAAVGGLVVAPTDSACGQCGADTTTCPDPPK